MEFAFEALCRKPKNVLINKITVFGVRVLRYGLAIEEEWPVWSVSRGIYIKEIGRTVMDRANRKCFIVCVHFVGKEVEHPAMRISLFEMTGKYI